MKTTKKTDPRNLPSHKLGRLLDLVREIGADEVMSGVAQALLRVGMASGAGAELLRALPLDADSADDFRAALVTLIEDAEAEEGRERAARTGTAYDRDGNAHTVTIPGGER